jgi:hypothetical protein
MSIMAAIDLAVRLQLVQDRPNDYQEYDRVMGAAIAPTPGFDFDAATFGVFLQKVSRRLRFDTPILIYDWTKTDAPRCLTANRELLIEIIAKDTTFAPGG